MPLERPLRKLKTELEKTPDMVWVEVPKSRLRRPFPLWWGIAALALFGLFAVVTQLQFSRIADDKFYQQQLDTYEIEKDAYDVALKAHGDCVDSIDIRETYRKLFNNAALLFEELANAPAELLPGSETAIAYQLRINERIEALITIPVEDELKPRLIEDCPPLPTEIPERPVR